MNAVFCWILGAATVRCIRFVIRLDHTDGKSSRRDRHQMASYIHVAHVNVVMFKE
jgi:hypothetical protein